MKTRKFAALRIRMKMRTQEERAWARGYRWAMKNGYESIRDCRMIAMAYAMGWISGNKRGMDVGGLKGYMEAPRHECGDCD